MLKAAWPETGWGCYHGASYHSHMLAALLPTSSKPVSPVFPQASWSAARPPSPLLQTPSCPSPVPSALRMVWVLNAPAHALFCRFKSCSPCTEIIAQCCSTGCSLCVMTRPGSGLDMAPWLAIDAHLQFTSVFLSSLDAVTLQGRGGLCCAAPSDPMERLSGFVLDFFLKCLCLRVSHPGAGERETCSPQGLLGLRSECLLGKGLSVPSSCLGSWGQCFPLWRTWTSGGVLLCFLLSVLQQVSLICN